MENGRVLPPWGKKYQRLQDKKQRLERKLVELKYEIKKNDEEIDAEWIATECKNQYGRS